MWIHIVLFVLILGLTIFWRIGWFQIEGLNDKKGRQLFLLVAFLGNMAGAMLTISGGHPEMEQKLKREEDMSYEQKLQVSIENGENGTLYLEIPEKETEQDQEEHSNVQTEQKEDLWQQQLREEIVAYNEEKADPNYYYLPEKWNGKRIYWAYPVDHTGTLLAAFSIFAAFMVLLKKNQEEQEIRAKRYEELLMDYPGLVMKFTLFIQAGMTVRKTFQRIALDYKRKKNKNKRAAYEEILNTCYEMESGISEWEAYRRFGERCGQIKYKTFATLLIQNLQKGSRHLADLLENESMEAWDERKRKARVQGEIASTKLLFPMILMLMVVMALIMIPAFLSFYG